jgi:hypothetical protein
LAELVKKGTHGTSAANAKAIRERGFLAGSGRAGHGVYFWAENAYSRQLAIAWFLQCRGEGRYGAERMGAVIYATIRTDGDETLNLDSPEVANRISILINSRGIRYWTAPRLAALWDGFIKEMEASAGVVFRVLVTRLAPPGDQYCTYPIRLLGAPFCYIVRILNCIENIDIEGIRE